METGMTADNRAARASVAATTGRRTRPWGNAFAYAALVLGLVVVLLPFWYMLITSFKPQSMVFEYPPQLWPRAFAPSNYLRVLTTANFARYFGNSVVVASLTVLLTMAVSSLMAYVFARMRFRGKEAIFSLLLIGMMVPPVMLIIPQFLVARSLDLFNSYRGLILVYATMNIAMQTFLLRGVFENVPIDLEEAAVIDGAGRLTVFTRVILPLSGPGLAVVAINTFLYSWEEYAWALVSMQKDAYRTLPIAIANFRGEHMTEWGLVFAATVIALVPVIAIFLFFQRYLIQGISTTGLKG
jgi:multiple sugar transport system permease protein